MYLCFVCVWSRLIISRSAAQRRQWHVPRQTSSGRPSLTTRGQKLILLTGSEELVKPGVNRAPGRCRCSNVTRYSFSIGFFFLRIIFVYFRAQLSRQSGLMDTMASGFEATVWILKKTLNVCFKGNILNNSAKRCHCLNVFKWRFLPEASSQSSIAILCTKQFIPEYTGISLLRTVDRTSSPTHERSAQLRYGRVCDNKCKGCLTVECTFVLN